MCNIYNYVQETLDKCIILIKNVLIGHFCYLYHSKYGIVYGATVHYHISMHPYFRMKYPFGVSESKANQIFSHESRTSHGNQYRGGKVHNKSGIIIYWLSFLFHSIVMTVSCRTILSW